MSRFTRWSDKVTSFIPSGGCKQEGNLRSKMLPSFNLFSPPSSSFSNIPTKHSYGLKMDFSHLGLPEDIFHRGRIYPGIMYLIANSKSNSI